MSMSSLIRRPYSKVQIKSEPRRLNLDPGCDLDHTLLRISNQLPGLRLGNELGFLSFKSAFASGSSGSDDGHLSRRVRGSPPSAH